MRAQLSIEFLIYLSLSSASLLSMLYLYGKGSSILSADMGQSSIAQLVTVINSNIGYYQSSFSVLIPSAICTSNVTQTGISLTNETYRFCANVTLDKPYLCSMAGHIASLNMTRFANGTFYVR